MKITQTQKVIFIIAMFSVTGFILYKSFFSSNNSSVNVNNVVAADGQLSTTTDSSESQDIIDLANRIDSISIDSALFNSSLFKNLKDFDLPLLPESQGRPNPFATIGNDAGFQNISTTSKPTNKKSGQ